VPVGESLLAVVGELGRIVFSEVPLEGVFGGVAKVAGTPLLGPMRSR